MGMPASTREMIAPAPPVHQRRFPRRVVPAGTQRGILLPVAPGPERLQAERLRRVLNCGVALLILLVAAPLMLVVAALVKLTSSGPVLYLQPRVGIDRRRRDSYENHGRRRIDYGGRLFTIYKFRTMCVDTGGAGQVWATPDDPRITPVGGFLRKYRLDELPQLINVLKGDMNLVGPRPEQPKIFVDLRSQIDRYHRRQRVLPGITGWAQVNQQYDTSIDDVRNKLMLDLEYIENCSPGSDLKIMFRTVPVMIFRKGGW